MATYMGFKYPFQKGPSGIPAPAVDEEVIKASITQIMNTALRERVMRPEFGVNFHANVFENNDDPLAEVLKAEVIAALSRFEPRCIVTDVKAYRPGDDPNAPNDSDGKTFVDVFYTIPAMRKNGKITIPTRKGS